MISVVICTYNRAASLADALRSLAAVEPPRGVPWEIVVVDNNSKDATRAEVERFAAETRIPVRYAFEPSQGVGYARNRGAMEAKGDWVVYTDDDVEFDKYWLVNLHRTMEESGCAAVGGRVLAVWPSQDRPPWLQEEGPFATPGGAIPRYDLGDQFGVATIPPITANAALRRSLFDSHGPFRTDLPIAEDTEFFQRLLDRGEKVVYAPDAIVYHPVPRKRVTKKYFTSWSYNAGRISMRLHAPPATAKRYFGVPRYFLRNMAALVPRWLTASNEARRFYYWLRLCTQAGQIVECRTLSKQH